MRCVSRVVCRVSCVAWCVIRVVWCVLCGACAACVCVCMCVSMLGRPYPRWREKCPPWWRGRRRLVPRISASISWSINEIPTWMHGSRGTAAGPTGVQRLDRAPPCRFDTAVRTCTREEQAYRSRRDFNCEAREAQWGCRAGRLNEMPWVSDSSGFPEPAEPHRAPQAGVHSRGKKLSVWGCIYIYIYTCVYIYIYIYVLISVSLVSLSLSIYIYISI